MYRSKRPLLTLIDSYISRGRHLTAQFRLTIFLFFFFTFLGVNNAR
jgi:hypothetical protein